MKSYKLVSKKDYLKVVENINENIINELSNTGIHFDEETQKRVKNNTKNNNNPLELKP